MTRPVLDSKGFLITPRREALALWSLYREHPEVLAMDLERDGTCAVAETIVILSGRNNLSDDELPVMEELNEIILDTLPETAWPEIGDQTDEDRLEIMAGLGLRIFGAGSDD